MREKRKRGSDVDIDIAARFSVLSTDEKLTVLYSLFQELAKSGADIQSLPSPAASARKEILIPLYIFQNSKLSSLESIVKYLHEQLRINFNKIALLLNRSGKTIWATYANAKAKMPEPFQYKLSSHHIPVSIIRRRDVSVLEGIVEYLRDQHHLSFIQIAFMLNRSSKTIWTVYKRAKIKRTRIAHSGQDGQDSLSEHELSEHDPEK